MNRENYVIALPESTISFKRIDITKLKELLEKAKLVGCGAPDQYQMHQNNLTRHIAEILIGFFGEEEVKK